MSDIEDTDELVAELQTGQVSGRSKLDKHREFQTLFLGSDVGKRVLLDIMDLGGYAKNPADVNNANRTYLRCGEINTVQKILEMIQKVPTAAPTRQNLKDEQ